MIAVLKEGGEGAWKEKKLNDPIFFILTSSTVKKDPGTERKEEVFGGEGFVSVKMTL